MTAAVLAVDGGNSKADVALIGADATLLAAVRTPSMSHQAVGLEAGMRTLVEATQDLARVVGLATTGPIAKRGVFSLAGADFPEDVRLLERAIGATGVATDITIVNDTFGALRAGTDRPWGVALVCGHGINAAAISPSGRRLRFDGVGDASGDWGGGGDLGREAVAAAVRSGDGRGPRTSFEHLVPAHFGLKDPGALTKALYFETVAESRVAELAPLVFWAAGQGDLVARGLLDRLADELSGMANALIRRLRMTRLDPEVVLAGGVFRARDDAFALRLARGIHAVAPKARIERLEAPPVLGAALLGLDAGAPGGFTTPEDSTRLREALVAWDTASRHGAGAAAVASA